MVRVRVRVRVRDRVRVSVRVRDRVRVRAIRLRLRVGGTVEAAGEGARLRELSPHISPISPPYLPRISPYLTVEAAGEGARLREHPDAQRDVPVREHGHLVRGRSGIGLGVRVRG